ncbi:hypothetical protein MATL_G00128190 [Megalops atlanticus]|uniref:Ig-like domain-containing protein n=1 Tax=Megalops atlanticus TaxID=7932 RepID=A0A9D3T4F5_MEGAT|nr:hypothetical protein MATL_G00128190 [Megalops atlanticus]
MPNRQTWLWSDFVSLTVLYLGSVRCKEFYVQLGMTANLPCDNLSKVTEVEWMYGAQLIIRGNVKTGNTFREKLPVSSRARLIGGSLQIRNVESADSGHYTCKAKTKNEEHDLYVVTVSSSPSGPFLRSKKVDLRCQIGKSSKIKPKWLRPDETPVSEGDTHTLPSVDFSDEGKWVCQIADKNFSLNIAVLGILPGPNLTVNESDSVVLPCVLSNPVSKYAYQAFQLLEGGWAQISPKSDHLLSLRMEGSELYWNKTGVRKKELQFSSEKLGTNLSLMLKDVKMKHAGQYQCSLKFKDKGTLKFQVSLQVKGQPGGSAVVPGTHGNGSIKGLLFGLNLWLWVAIGVGSLVVISLIATVVCLYQRHKRMKKRRRQKRRSIRQPLTARDYCQCNRSSRGPPNGRQQETSYKKGHQC